MPESTLWFTLVFLVLLKIPLAYLVYVIWWAVKDPPAPGEGFGETVGGAAADGPGPGSWWRRRMATRPLRRGPHGSAARRPATFARARSKTQV